MTSQRLEAFSDGVIAIILTIMVLDLHVPAQRGIQGLAQTGPTLFAYVLSFLVIAVIWVNHHHILRELKTVDAALLWTNINLLFWMSLIPFITAYLGRFPHDPFAVALYGLILCFCASAFGFIRLSIARHVQEHQVKAAFHRRMRRKNGIAAFLYLAAMPLAYVSVYLSFAIFIAVPLLYAAPEKAPE